MNFIKYYLTKKTLNQNFIYLGAIKWKFHQM